MRQEKSLKGAVFMVAISKYSNIIITLFFNVILARILTPEDYGVVAIITVFTTFFSILSDTGFGVAVIQNKALIQQDIDHIYTFTIYLGILLGVMFAAFSNPIASFYQNAEYVRIGCILAVSVMFSAFNMVPNAIIMRNKYFSLSAMRTIFTAIIKGIFTLVLAIMGARYYALVIATVFSSIFIFAWNRRSAELHFTYKVSFESLKKIWSYSISQFAFNLVNYFSRNLDNLLTGKFMGSVMLGYYDKSYQLMVTPTSGLTNVITPALHPIFSDYQNNKRYLYEQYIKIVRLLAIAGVFCSAFCFFASKEIILIMYGDAWEQSISCFTFLSLSIWSQVITSSTGAIFQSAGDTKRMFYVGSFNALINVIACIFGIWIGNIAALALCIGICYNIHFFTSYFVLIKFSLEMSYGKFLLGLWREFFLGILLAAAVVLFPFNLDNILLSAFIKAAYLGIVFLVGLVITNEHKFILLYFHRNKPSEVVSDK